MQGLLPVIFEWVLGQLTQNLSHVFSIQFFDAMIVVRVNQLNVRDS